MSIIGFRLERIHLDQSGGTAPRNRVIRTRVATGSNELRSWVSGTVRVKVRRICVEGREMTRGRRKATQLPRVGRVRYEGLVVLTLFGVTIAFCYLLSAFQGQEAHAHDRAARAMQLVSTVRAIDGVEWRAIAGEPLGDASARLSSQSAALKALLRNGVGSQSLAVMSGEYVGAVGAMFDALRSGDRERAEALDLERVDPAFDRLIGAAEREATEQARSAERTELGVQRLAWATTWALVVVAVVLARLAFGLRSGSLKRRMLVESEERFRSVVEGSRDVFTLISADGDVVVLNRDPGVLALVGIGGTVKRIGELVTGASLEDWVRCDALLRSVSGGERFEFDRSDGAGVVHHFEAIGSCLAGRRTDTVWVWRDVTDRRRLEAELHYRALHDSLTGLANRVLFRERIDEELVVASRTGEQVAVLFCDLDDFKNINDTLGHEMGDELLRTVADRLSQCTRGNETVARLGGDEFAIVMRTESIDAVRTIAERMLSAVGETLLLGDQVVYPSMSIGVVVSNPGDASDHLLRSADLAMYSAKRAGKRRLAMFDPSMHSQAVELLSLGTDVVSALRAGEFKLLFQPTLGLTGGVVQGVEALLRWDHPERGPLVPADFLSAAEASGMITVIGAWVMGEACRAAVEFASAAGRPITMAVNVSPQQLRDSGFADMVLATLSRSGLSPQCLVLEVTERILFDERLEFDQLTRLRTSGVEIAVDDFGTGYNLIDHLQRLPITTVKIDRSFVSGDAVANEHRHAFLAAMVGLAASLDLRCVAEGIENSYQAEELRLLGCNAAQGYFWSAPATFDDIARQLLPDRLADAASR